MDVRRLGSKHGRRRTPSVQGIILCPLLEEILLGLDHPKHQIPPRVGRRWDSVSFRGGKRADRAHVRSQGLKNFIYKQSVWAVAAAWRLAACTPTRRASAKLTLHRQCVCTPSWPLGRFASQLAPGGAPRPA